MSTTDLERELRELYASNDLSQLSAKLADLASADIVQEWPQSGERIRGRDNVLAVNRHYEAATGTRPSMRLRRLTPPGQAWVAEATIDYGDGTPISFVSILETDGSGRIVKETDYFANPFEAPEWRREWTEPMD